MMQSGFFITIEGVDGSGKSTVLKELEKLLKGSEIIKKFHGTLFTREPGGYQNALAEKIREIVLHKNDFLIDDESEAMLFAASRIIHVNQTILPALKSNNLVVSDRYVDSSYVYQGYAKNIPIEDIYSVNKFSLDKCIPDLTIVLMLEPKKALERIQTNARQTNRLDEKPLKYYEMVKNGYETLKERFPQRNYVFIDVDCGIQTAINRVYEICIKEINKQKGV